MAERPGKDTNDRSTENERFRRTIVRKENRKLRARREPDRSPWFWLGMFGLVGWSIAIPALLGILVGVWLDRLFEGRISWTLTMMLIGVAVGCWTAWYWVKRESQRP